MKRLGSYARMAMGAAVFSMVGCSAPRPQVTTDLTAGLEIAAALESAYAARSRADPKVVAQMARLLTGAEAAVTAFAVSTDSTDQAAASAAIAALVMYEASARVGR